MAAKKSIAKPESTPESKPEPAALAADTAKSKPPTAKARLLTKGLGGVSSLKKSAKAKPRTIQGKPVHLRFSPEHTGQ